MFIGCSTKPTLVALEVFHRLAPIEGQKEKEEKIVMEKRET
jgi:hypothetical protein